MIVLVHCIHLCFSTLSPLDLFFLDAGKRQRGAGKGEASRPGDFFRGLVQAAGEATTQGATIRGKQGEGNLIDWAVGATSGSSDYVKENKNRLGAAGAGGAAHPLPHLAPLHHRPALRLPDG